MFKFLFKLLPWHWKKYARIIFPLSSSINIIVSNLVRKDFFFFQFLSLRFAFRQSFLSSFRKSSAFEQKFHATRIKDAREKIS